MYSQDLRSRACLFYLTEYQSLRKTAKAFLVGKSTISRWINDHPFARKVRASQKRNEHLSQHILKELMAQPFHSIRTLHQVLSSQGFRVSKGTIHRCVRGLRWTWKKISKLQLHSKDQKEREIEFIQYMKKYEGQNWISIDETCIWSDFMPLRGYAPQSKRLLPLKKNFIQQRKKYSVLMAISRNGVVHTFCKEGSIKGPDFVQFIRTIPPQPPGTVLVMDNASIHKTKATLSAVQERSMIPIFTAPYRPDWNPIEHIFSPFKHHFRSLYMFPGTFIERILKAQSCISQSAYSHCFDCVEKRYREYSA